MAEESTTPDLVEMTRRIVKAYEEFQVKLRDGLAVEVREHQTLDEALQAVGPAE